MKRMGWSLDTLGVCASTLCIVHCLAFPLLFACLPLLRTSAANPTTASVSDDVLSAASSVNCTPGCCSLSIDFWIHVALLVAIAPLGIAAWSAGYQRHGRAGVMAFGVVGVALLSGALLFGNYLLGGRGEMVMTVLGSVSLVSAHLWNQRECRCCHGPRRRNLVELPTPLTAESPITLTIHESA